MLDTDKTVLNALNLFQAHSVKSIAELTGMKASTINSAINRLIDAGLAKVGPNTVERNARTFLKMAVSTADQLTADMNKRAKRRTATLVQIEELQAKIQELTQWKEWAIGLHPELAADPIVRKARELFAAKIIPSDYRDSVLAGKQDESAPLQVLIELLREQTA